MTHTVTQADLDYLAEVARDLPPLLTLDDCRCGCHGDYTDHSMRAGESCRSASIIIQD
jgi:hypothetical protein